MTSMRMRLLSSASSVALLLKRCRLLCEALVAASYCFSFETSTMQKPRVFAAFQTKNFENDAKNQLKKSKKSMVFATLSQKTLPKNKNKKHGKTKTPTHPVVDENLANYRVCLTSTKKNLPTINDTPRAAADARATLFSESSHFLRVTLSPTLSRCFSVVGV